MLIPYTVDVPMVRLPFANWALILVTSIISICITAKMTLEPRFQREQQFKALTEMKNKGMKPEDIERVLDEMEAPDDDPIPPLALKPHDFSVLQLFSCLFVHGGIFHLVGNMIFLFVFGNAVNAKLGHAQFLVSYFLLGALASLAWLVFGDGRPVVGASGAIMGIIGVFLVLFPRNDITMIYAFSLTFTGSFRVSSMWIILFYMVGDFYGCLRGGGGVAYIAHLGGTASGIAATTTAVALGYLRSTRYEQNLLEMMGWEPPKRSKKKKKKKKKQQQPQEDLAE
jgi:membrane associated rhomboid family serine protease